MLAHDSDKLTPAVQKCKLMIMTSAINHVETVQFFKDNKYFGGQESSFVFFSQATLPAVDLEGKIIMKSPYELQLSPNGNGALFESINTNRTVKAHIQKADYVQVIGVDNVLNKIMDPLQVGFTATKNLDATLKACAKTSPDEKVGVVVKNNGKYDIVEYSELSDADANKRDENGNLYLELGSILIFMLSSKKLIELSSDTKTLNKLYHKAYKKIEQWDAEAGKAVKPDVENGYKFELFLHNFLPFCADGKFGALKVIRGEEFGPVKNKDGAATDTPTTARNLLMESHT